MAATIRLMRVGKRGHANYRIVVMDKRKKRNGAYLEKIGFYDPHAKSAKVSLDKKRLDFWLQRGAVISEGMIKLQKIYQRKSANNP